MPLGNGLQRHEADVVAMASIIGTGIAEPDDQKHGTSAHREKGAGGPNNRAGPARAPRESPMVVLSACEESGPQSADPQDAGKSKRRRPQPPPNRMAERQPSASPSSASSPSSPSAASDLTALGATMVAMVKSRSLMTGSTPFGSCTWLMCRLSPMSALATSSSMKSGIAFAGHSSSTS